jgi:hypothetical protein
VLHAAQRSRAVAGRIALPTSPRGTPVSLLSR